MHDTTLRPAVPFDGIGWPWSADGGGVAWIRDGIAMLGDPVATGPKVHFNSRTGRIC
jgi:hypothetical protein